MIGVTYTYYTLPDFLRKIQNEGIMKGNNMVSKPSKSLAPITHLRSESEASHLIVSVTDVPVGAHLIGESEVRTKEQPHMSLGNYTEAHPPKGFAIHITPDPAPEAIVTQITQLGTGGEYELVLHIANYGNKTVSAEVWQL